MNSGNSPRLRSPTYLLGCWLALALLRRPHRVFADAFFAGALFAATSLGSELGSSALAGTLVGRVRFGVGGPLAAGADRVVAGAGGGRARDREDRVHVPDTGLGH